MSDGFFESKKRNVAGFTIVTRADSQEELEFMTFSWCLALVSPSIPHPGPGRYRGGSSRRISNSLEYGREFGPYRARAKGDGGCPA